MYREGDRVVLERVQDAVNAVEVVEAARAAEAAPHLGRSAINHLRGYANMSAHNYPQRAGGIASNIILSVMDVPAK